MQRAKRSPTIRWYRIAPLQTAWSATCRRCGDPQPWHGPAAGHRHEHHRDGRCRTVPDDSVHGRRHGWAPHPLRVGVRSGSGPVRWPRLRGAWRGAPRQRRPVRLPARSLPSVRPRPPRRIRVHLSGDARGPAVHRRRRRRVRRLPRLLLEDHGPDAAQRGGGSPLRRGDRAAVPRHRLDRPPRRADADHRAGDRRLGDCRRRLQRLVVAGVRFSAGGAAVRCRAGSRDRRGGIARDVQLRRLQQRLQHRRRAPGAGEDDAARDRPVDCGGCRPVRRDEHRRPRRRALARSGADADDRVAVHRPHVLGSGDWSVGGAGHDRPDPHRHRFVFVRGRARLFPHPVRRGPRRSVFRGLRARSTRRNGFRTSHCSRSARSRFRSVSSHSGSWSAG